MAIASPTVDNKKVQAIFVGRPLSPVVRRVVAVATILALAVTFLLDVLTPPDLSVEAAYEVPVAIAGLTGSRKTFIRVALIAAFLNVLGYVSDGVNFSFNDAVGLQDRVISLASLILVCSLVIIVQRTASQNAKLEIRQAQIQFEREQAIEIAQRSQELASRQEVIEELVEAIAHDVRTPLAALSLTLKQALRGQYGTLPESYREVALESRTSIDDIARLADTLLAVARFEAGAELPPRVAVPVAPLARDLVAEFMPLARAREVTLECTVVDEVVVTASDAELRRALGNLVANAIRHTPPGGRVTLGARRGELGWCIDVCDDGVGVAETVVPTLFARYTAGAGGTGLGLHIVKRIAEASGGNVSYSASAPHGSRFSIDLPAWAA
jgi:signal transduction histidine kinase